MKNKYFIVQNNMFTGYTDKTLAESIYSLSKQASLIEVLPDNKALLFNRTFDNPVSCDNVNHARYLASSLTKRF